MSELEQSRAEFEEWCWCKYWCGWPRDEVFSRTTDHYVRGDIQDMWLAWQAKDDKIAALKERIDNLENQLIEYQTMLGL